MLTASGVVVLTRNVASALLAMGSTSPFGLFQVPGLMVFVGGLRLLTSSSFRPGSAAPTPTPFDGPPGSSDNYQTLPGQDPSDDGAGGGGTDDP